MNLICRFASQGERRRNPVQALAACVLFFVTFVSVSAQVTAPLGTAPLPGSVVPTAGAGASTGQTGDAMPAYNGQAATLPVQNGVSSANPDAALYTAAAPETTLAAGDDINIRLFGDTEYGFTGRISVDGTILLPLIGIVPLQGLTVTGAEQYIAQRLETAGMYRNPQVILQVTEGPNAGVTLGGELHAVVPVVGSRSLYAVIAAGGGLPSTASRTVSILRRGHTAPISVELGTDPANTAGGLFPVFPGDVILVSHLGVVYVAGEFRTPGTVQMTNYTPLTLSQVSAMVGGPVWDARYNALHIIRTVGDHRTVTTINIKDVLYGKAPDPIMQPNDILFLPPSPIKSSLSNGSLGSILGVFSFALATFYSLR